MSLGKYIFASVLVLSLAIVAAAYAPAISQNKPSSYMLGGGNDVFVWRVNIANGSVSYCRRDSSSIDPQFVSRQTPFCSNATGPANH